MRFTGQVLTVVAALSGLFMILAAWAEFPWGVLLAFPVFLLCGSTAFVVALYTDRPPQLPLHGPVRKWGLSEDAMHQHVTEENR